MLNRNSICRGLHALLATGALAAAPGSPTAAGARPWCAGEAPDPPFDAGAALDEVRAELATHYAYWDRIDAPAAFDAAAPSLRASPDRATFAERLETLLLLFADGHLHLRPTPAPSAAWVPSAADLWLEGRGDRLVVRDVKAGSAAARSGVRPGWELWAIDGLPLRTAVAERFAALGIQPDAAQQLYAANALAAGRLGQARRMQFRVDGRWRELELPPGYESTRPAATLLSSRLLHDRAGHPLAVLRIANSLGETALIDAFDRALVDVPARAHVVIDLRDTPSGGHATVARALLGHFVGISKPYQQHELTSERVRHGVPRRWMEYVEPRPPFRGGRLFVLVGLWTGSMGEGLALGLQTAAGAELIGSQMGRLLGATVDDELAASCLRISFANERLSRVDGLPREDFLPRRGLPGADTAPDGSDPALRRLQALLALPHPGLRSAPGAPARVPKASCLCELPRYSGAPGSSSRPRR